MEVFLFMPEVVIANKVRGWDHLVTDRRRLQSTHRVGCWLTEVGAA